MKIKGPFTNIWGNPFIAENVQIGAYTEIGDDVVIEEDVVIGAMCFIPPKVRICRGAWIGPRVTFTNDKNPPSVMIPTVVAEKVRIGAGAVILPGITLGYGCMVGAGAVVTKDVPPGITVIGSPARPISSHRHEVLEKLDAVLSHAVETEERFFENMRWM